jgi:hypothetical protein
MNAICLDLYIDTNHIVPMLYTGATSIKKQTNN